MIRLHRPVCPNAAALASNYKHKDNKAALEQSTHGKCMYCESKIVHIDFAHVEHIKPKAPNKYPHLEFEWSNLGYACPKCNNAKSDEYDPQTPYIDPYQEDPEDHILFFGPIIYAKNGSERGLLTIQDVELNRADLVSRRQEKLDALHRSIKAVKSTQNKRLQSAALSALLLEASPDKEYSALTKRFLSLAMR